MIHRLTLAAAIVLVAVNSFAQINASLDEVEIYLEELAEIDENIDPAIILSDLEFFEQQPLNLNAATRSDLESIQLLNNFQILSFLKYREKVKTIISIYELSYIDGFNKKVVDVLLPFVYVGEKQVATNISVPGIKRYNKQTLVLDAAKVLEKKMGYISANGNEPAYLGNDMKLKAIYDFRYGSTLQAGAVVEKDPGEKFWSSKNNSIDYTSAHIAFEGNNWFKQLIVGDYHVTTGQGLLSCTGYGKSKSIFLNSLTYRPKTFKRNLSANEVSYLRGAALNLGVRHIDLKLFAAQNKIDATLSDSADGRQILSVGANGLHRTQGETNKQSSVKRSVFGADINYNSNRLKIGWSTLFTEFSNSIQPDTNYYKTIPADGKRFFGNSLNYSILINKIQFYGEWALCNGAPAVQNTVSFNLFQNNYMILVHRHYHQNYYSPLANGFGEGSNTRNEQGTFIGIEFSPYANWYVTAYYDVFRFPWLRYQVNSPTHGADSKVKLEYRPNYSLKTYLQYYYQNKENTASQNKGDKEKSIVNIKEQKVRLNTLYQLSSNLRLQSRLEWSGYNAPDEYYEGYLVFQDVKWMPINEKLSLTARYAWFNIPDYKARIYAYENSTRYSYSIPAYSGIGRRWYMLVNYTPVPWIDVNLRVAQTIYTDRDEIGSGNETIEGRQKTDINLQTIVKF